MARHRLDKLVLGEGGDALGLGNGVSGKAGFDGRQKQVPGTKLLHGS